jgi:hypothetical protein
MPLHYRHDFHTRLTNLNKFLRYSLGGDRPSQTTYQILSLDVFAVEIRTYIHTEWYFTVEYYTPKRMHITSPTYATQY